MALKRGKPKGLAAKKHKMHKKREDQQNIDGIES
jgi:hypothetical protein